MNRSTTLNLFINEGQFVLAKGYPLWEKAQGKVIKGLGQERISRLLKDLSAVVAVAQQG